MKHLSLTLLVVTLAVSSARAGGVDFDDLSHRAIHGDQAAMTTLRAIGPAGLDALLACQPDAADQAAWRLAVEQVAQQRDAYTSRLFWYTDFEAAKTAAQRTHKPILSLRLLGNLDEEFSCANSRFFRTALYANAEVSQYLRDHFVLHWKSVRPVPRITIDFGDGRTIETTITGNSIHYVLDAAGRPVDALPGLYGPKAFLKVLAAAETQAQHSTGLREYHIAQLTKEFTPEPQDARLDQRSRDLMRVKMGNARAAGRVAMTKAFVEDPMLRVIANFEKSLAEDTRQNETVLHRLLHQWFAADQVGADVEKLNQRVYAELFLMPMKDPWLGLKADGVYTALEANTAPRK